MKSDLEKQRDIGYDLGFFDGVKEAKRDLASMFIPETVEMTIIVRGKEEKIESIRRMVTFEIIRASSGKVLKLQMEETLAGIATKGILKDLLEGSQ